MSSDTSELSDVYDVSVLLEHSVGDVEFAEELLGRFHSRLGTISQSLENHLQDGDVQEAARIAHSLKGEAGIMAAARLQEVAARLEKSLRAPSGADPIELLDQLSEAVDQCLKADPAARRALSELQHEQP